MSDPAAVLHRLAGAAEPPVVLLVGFDRADAEALRTRLAPRAPGVEVIAGASVEQAAARRQRAGRPVAVVCFGDRFSGEEARRLLASNELEELLAGGGADSTAGPASTAAPGPPVIVAAAGPNLELFQELIAEDRIFYLSQRPPAPDELAALIGNAVRLYEARREAAAAGPGTPPAGAAPRRPRFEIAEVLRALAVQPGLADRAEVLAEAAREAVDAQRAYCLLHDPHEDTLWTRDRATGAERRDSAAVGIASFVLRSGMGLLVPRAGRDSRYDREADDPEGDGSERLIAAPVRDDEGRVLAVLVAVRSARESEFGAAHLELLERLAAPAAPFLPPPRPEEVLGDDALFRREALERYQQLDEAQDPLRLSPSWTRWTYWTLLGALVGALLFAAIAEVKEYASGLAVVWMGTRDDVTAEGSGTVSAVEVTPGQRVRPGQVLVRLHEAQEAAELARLDQEFELQLINRLRDPSDPGPQQALIGLRTQRQLASERLGERTLRAPSAGWASDVRVRPGQYLTAGQQVLSIVRDQDRPTVVVLLPGEYRPQVRRGMPLRFEIAGYRYAYQRLTVDSVSEEVVGPNEARRYLGPEIGDALQLNGPVVILKSLLPRPTFQAEGHTYRFHNGMHGNAEVEVRREKILVALVPGLKALLRSGGGG
jgi:multidrug efflux pump subunit AcrA (membrane-fusion protein)